MVGTVCMSVLDYIPTGVYDVSMKILQDQHARRARRGALAQDTTALSRKALLHRLNRIEGQVAGLKRALANEPGKDCLATLGQVKAVHSAVKHFAEAYVEAYALTCAREERVSPKFARDIKTIIASAFLI